jgi:hypothetical protein
VALFALEVTVNGDIVRVESPLTAAEAYMRTIELRRAGITQIVVIDLTTKKRIRNVYRLLRDLER